MFAEICWGSWCQQLLVTDWLVCCAWHGRLTNRGLGRRQVSGEVGRLVGRGLARQARKLLFIPLNTECRENVASCNIHNLIYESRVSYIVQEDAHSSFQYEAFLLIFENNNVTQAAEEFEMTILIELTFRIGSH